MHIDLYVCSYASAHDGACMLCWVIVKFVTAVRLRMKINIVEIHRVTPSVYFCPVNLWRDISLSDVVIVIKHWLCLYTF